MVCLCQALFVHVFPLFVFWSLFASVCLFLSLFLSLRTGRGFVSVFFKLKNQFYTYIFIMYLYACNSVVLCFVLVECLYEKKVSVCVCSCVFASVCSRVRVCVYMCEFVCACTKCLCLFVHVNVHVLHVSMYMQMQIQIHLFVHMFCFCVWSFGHFCRDSFFFDNFCVEFLS